MTCDTGTGTLPANATCATAEAHALTVGGENVNINASTAGSTANYPYCLETSMMSPTASADVVYAFTLASAGIFTVSVTAAGGSSLLPSIDVRTDCTMSSSFCESTGTSTGSISQGVAAGTYYVIVAGASCTNGAFTLTAGLVAQKCGNGVVDVDAGEQCDPGTNPPPNDGCGAPGTANPCQFLPPQPLPSPQNEDACPGQAFSISPGTSTNMAFLASNGMSTYGFKDDDIATSACRSASGATSGGLDRVFQLTPTGGGTMTVSVGYLADGLTDACVASNAAPICWARVLYARTACATAATEVACAVGVNGSQFTPATISFPVTANTPYWVFVDGYDANAFSYGPFNLSVKLQ